MTTQVKICGITNLEDARAAVEAGADFLGFILYTKSARYIEPKRVRTILTVLAETENPRYRTIGVFVNEAPLRVRSILNDTGLDFAQLHGDEGPHEFSDLAGQAFKAIRPASNREALILASQYAPLGPNNGPRLLIDAYDQAAYGGTGKRADWQAARQVARETPRLMLAGGLTPANVAQAVGVVHPWGVDVSSGVEVAPGRKDHAAVHVFVAAAKAV